MINTMFLILLTTLSLFYTPHNYGFIPAHTTACPSIKYYTSIEEILSQKPLPTIKKAKDKKKSVRMSKLKKKMLAEKNKEKEYLTNLIRHKDTDYTTFANEMIEFYNAKLKTGYKEYLGSSKPSTNDFEKYVIVLKDLLDDPEMLYIKNKKHNYITNNILNIIDGFELLIEYMNTSPYDYLSNSMMSTLHDVIYFAKK
jgi:hypothetical protein